MKVLVTGGTGFIGRALIRRLLSEGADVRALARNVLNSPAGAEVVRGDLTDAASCRKAVDGMDAVFHCGGVLGGWGMPERLFWSVNYEGTKNILEACMDGGVGRVVHVSSCGIFGPLRDGEVADEESPLRPKNVYEKTKAEAELLALSYARRGLPVTIVRPEFVYGPGDMHLLPLFRAVRGGRFAFFGGGTSLLHPTYIDDAVGGMIAAAREQKAIGQAFNIAGEKPVTVKEFIGEMAEAMGCPVPRADVPLFAARAAGILLDNTWGLFAEPPLTLAQVGYLSENRAFSTRKAERMLGYRPGVGLGKGMTEAVGWYRRQGLLR